jgi:hypothetical protein
MQSTSSPLVIRPFNGASDNCPPAFYRPSTTPGTALGDVACRRQVRPHGPIGRHHGRSSRLADAARGRVNVLRQVAKSPAGAKNFSRSAEPAAAPSGAGNPAGNVDYL